MANMNMGLVGAGVGVVVGMGYFVLSEVVPMIPASSVAIVTGSVVIGALGGAIYGSQQSDMLSAMANGMVGGAALGGVTATVLVLGSMEASHFAQLAKTVLVCASIFGFTAAVVT